VNDWNTLNIIILVILLLFTMFSEAHKVHYKRFLSVQLKFERFCPDHRNIFGPASVRRGQKLSSLRWFFWSRVSLFEPEAPGSQLGDLRSMSGESDSQVPRDLWLAVFCPSVDRFGMLGTCIRCRSWSPKGHRQFKSY